MRTSARASFGRRLVDVPLVLVLAGTIVGLFQENAGFWQVPGEAVALAARFALTVLGFVCALQFRVSRLPALCPVSLRLAFAGAPLYALSCAALACVLVPNLPLSAAMVLGIALMLNGAAFDRRLILGAPAPASVKSGVRFESAVIVALAFPITALGVASAEVHAPGLAAAGTGWAEGSALLANSLAITLGFAAGGVTGLGLALLFNRSAGNSAPLWLVLLFVASGYSAMLVGGDWSVGIVAGALIFSEQSRLRSVARLRARVSAEKIIHPAIYGAFGLFLGPRLFDANFLIVIFAVLAVTFVRAIPRLLVLRDAAISADSKRFFARFGGTPGTVSAVFLLSMLDHGSLAAPELVLTIGTITTLFGIAIARITAKPLAKAYLRGMELARRRALYEAV